jgi:hypothetical protein
MEGDMVARAREFIAARATHLIFSVPVAYSAAGVRQLWNEVVTPHRK